jgi:hypothetical protein
MGTPYVATGVTRTTAGAVLAALRVVVKDELADWKANVTV